MKKSLLLLLLLCSTTVSWAENEDGYVPFVVEGKCWKGTEVYRMSGTTYPCNYFIEGDTVIGAEKFKKCYVQCSRLGSSSPSYECALQETGKKVYSVCKGENEKQLLFDFTMKVGDTFALTEDGYDYGRKEGVGVTMKLISIDEVNGTNETLRRYNFQIATCDDSMSGYKNCVYSWTEGIGKADVSNGCIIGSPFSWRIDFVGGFDYVLSECQVDGERLYPVNVANGVVSPERPESSASPLYDLQGRMQKGLRRGISVGQGRKVIR